MKKQILTTTAFIGFLILSLAFTSTDAPCDFKSLKKEGISALDPFYYSSSKVSIINYDYRAQRKEIEVPLFKGEKYRMIFNKKELPKDVIVEIYDKDKSHDGRTPVFTTEGKEGQLISFEPKKSKKMYVNYIIPASKGESKKGCLAFVLGYQLTFIKDDQSSETEE